MVHYEITKTVVTDAKLFLPGGDVNRWAHKVEASLTSHMRMEAPLNERANKGRSPYPVGALRESISGSITQPTLRRFITTVVIDVPYALYVIKGTSRVYSTSRPRDESGRFIPFDDDNRGGMVLPPNFGHGWLRRYSVKGQTANDFPSRAFRATARSHSSLRSFRAL